MNWIFGGIFLSFIGVLIFISELIRKRFKGKPEITRKIVHITTGLFVLITPFVFDSNSPILAIALIFIPLNYTAVKIELFKSMHATERKSYGTIYYPIAFFILTLLLWDHYKVILITSILILAIADAMAAIVGRNIRQPRRYTFGGEPKSIEGSATMLVFSFIIAFICLNSLSFIDSIHVSVAHSIWFALITAVIASACESVSYKGSDNLTVPLGAAFTMHFMLTNGAGNIGFTIGIILSLTVTIISYRLKFLSGGGAVGTFLLGVIVFGIGGWKFSLPILTFFILSSVLSKIGKKRKQKLSEKFQKSSQRDLWQVMANGGIAGFAVLVWNYYPGEFWYYLFVASVAAANSDTWGTEIGVFSKIKPRNILNFKSVPVGSSGGITPLGTLGALLGSLVIALAGALYINNAIAVVVIFIAGFSGSIIDSIVGATVQAQYRCPNCHKITEKEIHCSIYKTELVSGWGWIDNDIVNGLCTLSGGLFAWIGLSFF